MQKLPRTSILGWIGVACILAAYGGSSFGLLSAQSSLYLGLNLLGSFGIVVEAREKKDTPALFLNIVWALIAFIGLVRFFVSS